MTTIQKSNTNVTVQKAFWNDLQQFQFETSNCVGSYTAS